jgi:perosamine synthetase
MAIIPISKPYIGLAEYKYVLRSLLENKIGGASENNLVCENSISNIVGHNHCKLTANGTVALQIVFDAVKHYLEKDQVTIIVPNVTFGATVNAALLSSNKVILADVDPKSGLISRESVIDIIANYSVDCICIVSLNGRLVPNEDIEFYHNSGLIVVEDQAEALLSNYSGDTRRDYVFASTLSFYANKIITSGEGGAVCFTKDVLCDWINTYVNHGMSQAGSYKHDFAGSNYRMSSYQAALLRAQLTRHTTLKNHRKKMWQAFQNNIDSRYQLPPYSEDEYPWLLELQSQFDPERLEEDLKKSKVQFRRFFSAMHVQPAFKNIVCPNKSNTEYFLKNRYFLPLYLKMTPKDLKRLLGALKK